MTALICSPISKRGRKEIKVYVKMIQISGQYQNLETITEHGDDDRAGKQLHDDNNIGVGQYQSMEMMTEQGQ